MIGLLLIDKPEGMTSFSAVRHIKRLANEKRVGHTGTLDPMATGVLPVFLGRATALSSFLSDADKRYVAGIRLGIVTDTDDITGNVLSKKDVRVSEDQIKEVLLKFTGKIFQKPPVYSAIKKDGQRMYKLAREGKKVEIEARDVEVFSLELIKPLDGNGEFYVDAHVSKGTYIRSLARDIGEELGCGATLCSLRREAAAGFDISQCVPLDEINQDNICEKILDPENAVMHLREISVTPKQAIRFCNGGQLSFERLHSDTAGFLDGELFRIKSEGAFLGVGVADKTNEQIAIKAIINYPEGMEK